MTTLHEDLKALRDALDAGPKFYAYGWRAWQDVNGTWQVGPSTNDAAASIWRDEKSEATADYIATSNPARIARLLAAVETTRDALREAEDVLSRSPFSCSIWPNGTHPNAGITQIRAALAQFEEKPHG